MQKLPIVSSSLKTKTEISTSSRQKIKKTKLNEVLLLSSLDGKFQEKVRVIGDYKNELVIVPANYKGKGEVLKGFKRYLQIAKALKVTGLLKLLYMMKEVTGGVIDLGTWSRGSMKRIVNGQKVKIAVDESLAVSGTVIGSYFVEEDKKTLFAVDSYESFAVQTCDMKNAIPFEKGTYVLLKLE